VHVGGFITPSLFIFQEGHIRYKGILPQASFIGKNIGKDRGVRERLQAWPRLSQNMRVTRENELLQSLEYRADAVHAFIGHSKDTYEANYKTLSDDDFVPLSQRQLDRSTTQWPETSHFRHQFGFVRV
jgi:hypothetical protein